MKEELNRSQNLFGETTESGEQLWQYVQSLSPETIAKLSHPDSTGILQVMERNILGC